MYPGIGKNLEKKKNASKGKKILSRTERKKNKRLKSYHFLLSQICEIKLKGMERSRYGIFASIAIQNSK